ncbi:DUF1722 domain-containing protein [Halopseudomonas nanhaiensis]|uniref:YbgA family protein n=1 Tax=Halopseudomonas nanhaiensis TaxID=2830842 RepID=UPI001CBD80DD|nr:DUF523 and DUF1722 domain-containing protein [Halopseudomonas nanhaiensis]UAW97915.1 DUF1722 domain-containing protein [Halopseudomonas nanhaiensis]
MSCSTPVRIPIGISDCLTGSPVRFNAGHKHSALCTEQLGQWFDLVPFCPEVAIGLGTPRQPIRLVGDPTSPRALGTRDPSLDITSQLLGYGEAVAAAHPELCGFILMQKSPSCGMERVKVYQDNGQPAPLTGSGLFAQALMRTNPHLPVEEEGRLNDPVLRENFITRVMVTSAWKQLQSTGLSRSQLIDFHARHKYLLLAHNPAAYRRLGRMLANLSEADLEQLAGDYFADLIISLKSKASRRSHSNVLEHIAGHFKRSLAGHEKSELRSLIEQYRLGMVPLVVPITLLKHHLMNHPDAYLGRQAYLQPYPAELSLRNAI